MNNKKSEWYSELENGKCPNCGHEYEPLKMANKGLDFEGAIFLAKSYMNCEECGTKLMVEVDFNWRFVAVQKKEKQKP